MNKPDVKVTKTTVLNLSPETEKGTNYFRKKSQNTVEEM